MTQTWIILLSRTEWVMKMSKTRSVYTQVYHERAKHRCRRILRNNLGTKWVTWVLIPCVCTNILWHTDSQHNWHAHRTFYFWRRPPQSVRTHYNMLQHTATHANTLEHTDSYHKRHAHRTIYLWRGPPQSVRTHDVSRVPEAHSLAPSCCYRCVAVCWHMLQRVSACCGCAAS